MRRNYLSLIYFLTISLSLSTSLFAQQNYYKFSIEKEGVYKITSEQALKLGFQSLNEISIFGYPGMLPQKLDSVNLNLQEIASLEKDGNLFFYLKGANTSSISEEGEVVFHPNLYSDSMSYVIGEKVNPQRIKAESASESASEPTILYQWTWIKENEINLINSGRNWYSRPLGSGVTRGYAIPLATQSAAPWRMIASVMAQSKSSSIITLAVDDLEISNTNLDAIPSTTYGIKGKDVLVDESFSPKNQAIERFRISYTSANPSATGYLEFVGIGVPYSGNDLKEGVYQSLNSRNAILPKTGVSVWNLDDFFNPVQIDFGSGSIAKGLSFVAFDPAKVEEIENTQAIDLSLRSPTSWPSLLIISPKLFTSSAEKLRTHKLGLGIYAEIAFIEDIYNSFGYGNKDLNALRNFLAWHFHKGKSLKNVLLLGKGTFDHKGILGGRPNLLPTYTSRNSLDPLASYSSDDYLGLIEYGQGKWSETKEGDEKMQIGVGRLPVINSKEASLVVDKIISYENNFAPGEWKQTVTLIADDGDSNLHLRDSELQSEFLTKNHPIYYQNKLYLDRFKQEKIGEVQQSAQAKKALEETLEKGTLILNYVGHGNETNLTAEEVFTVSDIENWADQDHLALWMTATCEFGRHDSPFIRSAAEELLIAPNKGAIGLLTTGRPVFSSANFSLNEAFIQEVFKEIDGKSQDLGAIFKNTKNNSQKGVLNRNFSLIGDPSLHLGSPEFVINFTTFTDPANQQKIDTLYSLREIQFEAEISNPESGSISSSFDGIYTIEVRDKFGIDSTLGDESPIVKFKDEKTILFKGTGTVSKGKMTGSFVLSNNQKMDVRELSIRISAVGTGKKWDAAGYRSIFTKETIDETPSDTEGPLIVAEFNGINSPLIFSSSSISLFALLSDESGINISDYNPQRSLTIQINNEPPIILNSYFIAKNNSFKSGNLNYLLQNLTEGDNLVTITAWDILGNQSVLKKLITIEGSDKLQILSHKTYPNPTSTASNFEIKHNQPGKNLGLTLVVYQMDGKILFENHVRLVKAESRIKNLTWLFLQSQTKYPAKGTYIYKLTLQAEDNNSAASVSGKIFIQ